MPPSGRLSGGATWSQSNKEIVILLPLPEGAKGKEVKFKCTSKSLDVQVRECVLKGDFFYAVKPDDSTWEIEDDPAGGRRLRLGLCKARANADWDCCFLDEIWLPRSRSRYSSICPSLLSSSSSLGE